MFRSRASRAVALRRGLLVAVACTALGACGNVKEWEEKPGTLTLRAAPLPAAEGMPLALSVEGSNVGPVSVYQGDSLIATFANLALDGKKSFTVTAVSDETPHAEAIAYDFKRVSVKATSLSGDPAPSGSAGSGGGGSGGEGGTNGGAGSAGGGAGGMSGGGGVPPVENCPGMLAGSVCSHPLGGSVQVTLFNQRSVTLAVFQRDPLPQPCREKAVGTIAPDSSLTLPNVEAGVSLVVREDPSGTEVKWFEVPGGPSCVLVF